MPEQYQHLSTTGKTSNLGFNNINYNKDQHGFELIACITSHVFNNNSVLLFLVVWSCNTQYRRLNMELLTVKANLKYRQREKGNKG